MATTGTGIPYVLTTTAQTVITASVNELVIITRLEAYNSDATSRIVTLHQVPDGDTADASNLVLKQSVYAGQSTSIDFSGAVVANGTLQALADVTSVVNLSVNIFKSDQIP